MLEGAKEREKEIILLLLLLLLSCMPCRIPDLATPRCPILHVPRDFVSWASLHGL